MPLLLVTAENLLGVQIDQYINLSPSAARAIFESTGPLSIDVFEEVKVKAGAGAQVLFAPARRCSRRSSW